MKSLKNVELFTDGACSGNPGAGGYAAILRYKGKEKIISSGDEQTTNNRMELLAVIEGLKALNEPCLVTVYTDSQYVANGLLKGWAVKWRANNWRKSDKKSALNTDLWEELLNLSEKHTLDIRWIKGHAGHPENERCDALARQEIDNIRKGIGNE